MISLKKLTD
ncbi:hypothetical protein S7711_11635, partial [Stachybotrys chartarum IBT 7711]